MTKKSKSSLVQMGDLSNEIDTILVPHEAFMIGMKELEKAMQFSPGRLEPMGLIIIGEPRSGKSRLIEAFKSKYPEKRAKVGLIKPVLVVSVPAVPTIKGLASEILRALGDQHWDIRETENQRTARLVKLLKDCGVQALALDEAQHFMDKGSTRTHYAVTNWLKMLMDETKGLIILSGLDTINHLLSGNEQLNGRFINSIKMPRFDWKVLESRDEFRRVLIAFKDGLESFELPEIGDEDIAFRFYEGTGGLIGYIIKILRQACYDACSENRLTISLQDIEVAWSRAVRPNSIKSTNPFSRDLKPC